LIRLEVSYRGIIMVGLGLLSLWALTQLWPVVVLVLASLIIMMGLLPYVEAMVQRGIPRSAAVLFMLLAFVAILLGLLSLVVPALIDEFKDLRNNLPDSAHEIDKILHSFDINTNLEQRARDINWDEIISGRAAVSAGQRVLTVTISVITVVAMTAYFLIEMPSLARFVYQFIPEERRKAYDELFQDISRVVGGYLRGQFITSLTIGIYTFVVLRIVGVANPLAFAVLAGFADIIPLVGAFIATIPPVAAALEQSSTHAAIVLGLLLAYQQFEDRFFVPRVYGRTLNLPPIIVLIAVLAGAELLGITGVLLALPLTAAGRVWLDYMLRQRGVSLSPIEPSPEAHESGQAFVPDAEEEDVGGEPRAASLVAVASRPSRPQASEESGDSGQDQSGVRAGQSRE
jgi:predicted PurR-regulated permease PerM